jgi:UDP-N-acetylmuramyl pentapeptide phosphotransferase/UDP-N-acetylglucosamine-1-phosphate transferase
MANMLWFDQGVLIFILMSLILNGLISYLWYKKFYRHLGLNSYQAIQRIHLNETPRLGGLIFLTCLAVYVIFADTSESILILKFILLSLIPIIVVGAKEDLFHNVEPAIRLLSLLLVGWLFLINLKYPLPNLVGLPFIEKLILLHGGISIFYILSIVGLANGMNLIDGVNGLCGYAALSILGALMFLSYKMNDITMVTSIFTLIVLLIPFMLINYPYGLIFLGDLGAYSLGSILAMLTIILFGRHPEISPWGAVLILIYPITEVFFTLFRRLIKGNLIFQPDKAHLHLKLFLFLRSHPSYKKVANALVTPILSALWMYPIITIGLIYYKSFFILIAISSFFILYLIFYLFVPSVKNNKKRIGISKE